MAIRQVAQSVQNRIPERVRQFFGRVVATSSARIKTPTVIQMEEVECGAAALKIIMDYHSKIVPLEELRIACGVSRDGSKASNIVKAARRYGFNAKGYRKEPAALREMQLPLIAFWNFNHYLVVEGFDADVVYLNDPATGPRTVTHQEFDVSFTGVVLVFEPGDDFEPSGSRPSIIRLLGDWLVNAEGGVTMILLLGLLLVIPGLVIPGFSRIFIDDILIADNNIVPLLLVSMIVVLVLNIGFTGLQRRYLLRLQTKLAIGRSGRFLWHILRLPVEFFTQRYPADINARISINDRVAQLLTEQLALTFINLLLVIFYAGLMFIYDGLMAITVILIAVLNFVVLNVISRQRVDINRRLQQERGKLTGVTVNGLASIETIKATGSEESFFSNWSGYHAKSANAMQQMGRASLALIAVPPFLSSLNMLVVLGVGGLEVVRGNMTPGTLVAFQALMVAFTAPINQFVSLGGLLQDVVGDMERLQDVMHYPVDAPFSNDRPAIVPTDARLNGRVELVNITFGYSQQSAPLISNLNITIEPGQRVAFVGRSGSGKSTVAKLIAGLYPAWEGDIRFDDVPREQIAPLVLHNSLAMVDQDIMLLRDTIRNNIVLWDSTIPEEDIIQAAKDAAIHTDIIRRGGYNTLLSEDGRDLSGGQRQRIEIARALAIDPSIIILDEATSALDPTTEKHIDDAIRRRGCTAIIVAHRLSTIRDCDEIIVMSQGQVVQRGTHDAMIQVGGAYTDLIASEEYMDDTPEMDPFV